MYLKEAVCPKGKPQRCTDSSLVKLLSKLPQSSTRTHYLQKVSEQLSKGQARLAIQFEQDLRNQVKVAYSNMLI